MSVCRGPPRWRQVVVHRRTHERVHEPQAIIARKDVLAGQGIRRCQRIALGQTRQRPRDFKLSAVSEHCDRAGQVERGRVKTPQPQ